MSTLGAVRCSAKYLEALNCVLGNQAAADRIGALLELNLDNPVCSPRTMRTILQQMHGAGLVNRHHKYLGAGRVQWVYVYRGRWMPRVKPERALHDHYRRIEEQDMQLQAYALDTWDGKAEAEMHRQRTTCLARLGISAEDLPY